MKKILFGLLAVCTWMSCKKDDPQPAVPTYPVTAGKYSFAFDSVKYEIDSMQISYSDPSGIKTPARIYGAYRWESPSIQYRENDSAFAQVTAWGRYRSVTAFLPRMEFSGVHTEGLDFHIDVLEEATVDGKNAFVVGRHERY
jgi:hypothetical protein